MRSSVVLVLSVSLLTLSGCASAVKRHEQLSTHMNYQIDCSMADSYIAELEQEKASMFEKIANGVATVLPTSAIFNLLAGEFGSRRNIASGKFDQQLVMKIDEIESTCDG